MEQIKSLFVAMLCGFALLIASCIIFREWPIVVVFAIGGSFFVARWVYSKMLERYGVIPVSKWQVEQYNPETHVFKIVGIEHNIGKKYVAENIDHIKECARLSREYGRSKDPHAVSLVVDGRVVGYISRAYSYIIAPVLDANPDAAVSVHAWDLNGSVGACVRFTGPEADAIHEQADRVRALVK